MSNNNSPLLFGSEPWKRLWITESKWSAGPQAVHSLGRPLGEYRDRPFLLLLGRPGSGKSHELKTAQETGELGVSLFVEAKEIGSESPGAFLDRALANTHHSCRIILDGLDEALLANLHFVNQLKSWFDHKRGQDGIPFYTLALSCRWADWPESPLAALRDLWPRGEWESLVLAPLSQVDIRETAERNLGDSHAGVFLRKLDELNLEDVAKWPQSLLGLVRSFKKSAFKELASSYTEIIRTEVDRNLLLSERDERHRWKPSIENLKTRKEITGRIAALMIWSGKSRLSLGSGPEQSDCVSPPEVLVDLTPAGIPEVGLADLDDMVRHSRIFRKLSGSEECWVFESQVYQEWLAARWLADRKLDEGRYKQLFGTEVEGRWQVFPVLKATAAWLANFDPDFRKLILREDPLTLLRMDGAELPDEDRREVVQALLESTERLGLIDPGVHHALFHSLNHPGLQSQLTAWITNRDADDASRELAVKIAAKADLSDIAPTLWETYPEVGTALKIKIARALTSLAEHSHDAEWKKVLRGNLPTDVHGELLASALEILVIKSEQVPVREVLEHLIPAHDFGIVGRYDLVLRQIPDRITPDDVPSVLARLSTHGRYRDEYRLHSILTELEIAAVRMAVENFSIPEIRIALLDYWHARLLEHRPLRKLLLKSEKHPAMPLDDGLRLEIAEALLRHRDLEKRKRWFLPEDALLQESDFAWCVDRLLEASPADQWRFALPIESFVRRSSLSEDVEKKLEVAWTASDVLREMLPSPLEGESIGEAIRRITSAQIADREKKTKNLEKRQDQRQEAIASRLKRYEQQVRAEFERGLNIWPQVVSILCWRDNFSGGAVDYSLLEALRPQEEEWMLEAARRFLLHGPSEASDESNQGLYGLLAAAALREELEKREALHVSVGKDWLPLLIECMTESLGESAEFLTKRNLHDLYPEQFFEAVGAYISDEYLKGHSLSALHVFSEFRTPEMLKHLGRIVSEQAVRARGFFDAIAWIAEGDKQRAFLLLQAKLEGLAEETDPEIRKAVISAALLLADGRLMGSIEFTLKDDQELKDAIMAAAGHLEWRARDFDCSLWPDEAVRSLANHCHRQFGTLRERMRRGGASLVTDEDRFRDFRRVLTEAAVSRGIKVKIPEVYEGDEEGDIEYRKRITRWYSHEAFQSLIGRKWRPLAHPDFFRLTTVAKARLARTNDELLTVVKEVLVGWEHQLRSGSYEMLWNTQKNPTAKNETWIAKVMRDWLQPRLETMVEAEVTLRSERRIDLMVQSMAPQGGKLTVVIELKKVRPNNRKERDEAIKGQLRPYLEERQKEEGWTHGLYVVAWTPSPNKPEATDIALEAARRNYQAQAGEASTDGIVIESMVIDARLP
jgi:hypothetical protein